MTMQTYQLLIIGGGASGLAAAVAAASLGVERIAILEKLPRTGKKLLATGNGRCNLSHVPISADDYSGTVPTASILEEFGDVTAFFEQLGLYVRTDSAGRMYPYSMTAAAVLDAFRLRLAQYSVEEHCNCEVTALKRSGKRWLVQTSAGVFASQYVIFAAGGHAAPRLGTDGSAWRLLKDLGLPLALAHPILCPVLSDPKLLRPLKGLRVKGEITLTDRKKPLRTETGEVQFTEKALSGICVFNLSGLIDTGRLHDYALVFNAVPGEPEVETLAHLYTLQGVRCDASCEDLLTGLVQKPFARLLLKSCGIAADMPCSMLDDRRLRLLAAAFHSMSFPVTGLTDFTQAQATAGGVTGTVLDEHLSVRTQPGLYVTGEAADVHADCGGYHLHWCWASGTAAATDIARRIAKKGDF